MEAPTLTARIFVPGGAAARNNFFCSLTYCFEVTFLGIHETKDMGNSPCAVPAAVAQLGV